MRVFRKLLSCCTFIKNTNFAIQFTYLGARRDDFQIGSADAGVAHVRTNQVSAGLRSEMSTAGNQVQKKITTMTYNVRQGLYIICGFRVS